MNPLPFESNSPVELAQALIRTPTVTPEDGGLQGAIGDFLKKAGFSVRHFNFGGVANLTASFGRGSPNVCLVGHTDVVPVGDEKKWSIPPFEGRIAGDRLIGRGACDMKGAVACQMIAARRFIQKNGGSFKGKISLIFSGNEETSEPTSGAAYLLEQLAQSGEKIDYALVGEPTNPKEMGEVVKQGRRGIIQGSVSILGKQGHVGYPHLVKNPIHHSLSILRELAQCDWDGGKPQTGFQSSNLQLTEVKAGSGVYNIIPGNLIFKFAIRYNPSCSLERVETECHRLLRTSGLEYKLDLTNPVRPFFSENARLMATLKEIIKKRCGKTPEFNTTGGASDAYHLAERGIAVMEFGLAGGSLHQVDEWARIADIELLAQIYEEFLTAMTTV